jgi:hypothetical protein
MAIRENRFEKKTLEAELGAGRRIVGVAGALSQQDDLATRTGLVKLSLQNPNTCRNLKCSSYRQESKNY